MSEIFEEFEAILMDKGLIKKAEASKKPNPRYDSLDLEAIEMLYGVKPNDEEDHIIEQAHPESVIVAPAYDRINGLVENLLERQNIMVGIVTKPNNGKLVQRRYVLAHDDLLNELLKTAFMLDKKGQDDLMKLADNCAERLVKKKLIKTAFSLTDILEAVGVVGGAGALVAILGGGPGAWALGAGVLGIAVLVNNFSDHIDQGVVANCDKAIDRLQRILDDEDEAVGLDDKISAMIEEINTVKEYGIEAIDSSVTLESDEEVEEGRELVRHYFKAINALSKKMPSWIRMLGAAPITENSKDTYTGFGSGLLSVLEEGVG